MQPIRNTKTARLRNLKMYREDLDEFVAFFQRACTRVTISDNRNRYESLNEMKEHIGSRIKDLDIRGERPNLHFLLNQKQTVQSSSTPAVFNELRTEEITDEADALFFRVKEFLEARQRPIVRWQFAVIAIIGLTVGVTFLLTHRPDPWIALGFTLLSVVSTVAGLKIDNQLILETKLNSPSFWVRHHDAFETHVINSAISGIIGYLLGRFLK